MTVRQDLTNWQPREFVLQAGQQSLDVFLAGSDCYFYLIVLLDEPNSELALGLMALEASREGEADGLAFRTVVRDIDATLVGDPKIGPSSVQPLPRSTLAKDASHAVDKVPRELLKVPCHIVPIRKRAERSFIQHVSVGRARNHDIVLRHRSVSKFHAWFEVDDSGVFYLGDAKSTNATKVNGKIVMGPGLTRVDAGAELLFGSVEATLCAPDTLWDAVTGAP